MPDNVFFALALLLSVATLVRGFVAFKGDAASIVGLASLSLAVCVPLAIIWHTRVEPEIRIHIGKTYSDSSLGTVSWAGFALTVGFLCATTFPTPTAARPKLRKAFSEHRNFVLCTVLLLAGSLRLIQLYGGLLTMLRSPGQAIPGQFFALIMVCSAWLGLLVIAGGSATRPFMKRCAQIGMAEAFIVTLFNSRLLAIMLVAQYQIYMFSNNSGQSTQAKRSSRQRSIILLIAIPCVALVYGLYREQSSVAFTPKSVFSWLFQNNLEPIPGAASVADTGSPGFVHVMRTIGVMVLNAAPGFSSPLPLEELPRVGSIVPSGFEQAWAAAGPLGTVLLGSIVGIVARWCDSAKGHTPRRLLLGPVVVFMWRNSIAGSFSFLVLWMFPWAMGLLRPNLQRPTLKRFQPQRAVKVKVAAKTTATSAAVVGRAAHHAWQRTAPDEFSATPDDRTTYPSRLAAATAPRYASAVPRWRTGVGGPALKPPLPPPTPLPKA